MKKKVFELLFDDEENKFEILSETNPFDGLDPYDVNCGAKLENYIEKLVEMLLGKRDNRINKIIRALTLADICSDLQPYENIEHLWTLMMFYYLPKHERHFRKMKERLGMKVKVNEPITYVNPAINESINSKMS